MLEPWNDKSIMPPPISTSLCQICFSMEELKNSCDTIIRVLSKQSPLHKESAIFSRFLYKFDKKFRNDIGFRKFKKVNTALHKYLSLPIVKDVQNFIDILPLNNNEKESYLPTKQMLQYVMVRLMTFSKLMCRIAICSKQAAIFYLNRIKLGESHWMCLMPYALLCRIWSMASVLLQHSCNWYNQLYPYLVYMPNKGLDFLPKGYVLPEDLEKWNDLKNLSQIGRYEWSQKSNVKTESIITEDDESDLSDNILKYVNDINSKAEGCDDEPVIQMLLPKRVIQTDNVMTFKNQDEGVAISRDSFKKMINLQNGNNPLASIGPEHAIKSVTNRDSLIKFVENEEEYRNKSNDTSLTSHLSFMQWQALKITLLKLDDSMLNTKKLEKKVKRIWEEKCLDYL